MTLLRSAQWSSIPEKCFEDRMARQSSASQAPEEGGGESPSFDCWQSRPGAQLFGVFQVTAADGCQKMPVTCGLWQGIAEWRVPVALSSSLSSFEQHGAAGWTADGKRRTPAFQMTGRPRGAALSTGPLAFGQEGQALGRRPGWLLCSYNLT